MNVLPVIIAGGSDTRLWPLSRSGFPKQFLALGGNETLFQKACLRCSSLAGDQITNQPPVIVTNEEHRFLAAEQLLDLSVRESLDPAALNKILKLLQRKAKLRDIGELSGHSFRVGAAVDLLDKGVPLERIMLRGGWKSKNTAIRYLRNWDDSDWLIVGET